MMMMMMLQVITMLLLLVVLLSLLLLGMLSSSSWSSMMILEPAGPSAFAHEKNPTTMTTMKKKTTFGISDTTTTASDDLDHDRSSTSSTSTNVPMTTTTTTTTTTTKPKKKWHEEEDDGFASSAFSWDMYETLYQTPFKEFPCQPHKIHLSQATNYYSSDSSKVQMTVSFTLDYEDCASVIPAIAYGRQAGIPEGVVLETERVAFQYKSRNRQRPGKYQSDWIHHMRLKDLQVGLETYWYQIIIFHNDTNMTKKNNTNTNDDASDMSWWSSLLQEQDQMSPPNNNDPPVDIQPERLLRGSGSAATTTTTTTITKNVTTTTTTAIMGQSPSYHFTTPPFLHQPTSLALVGDLGQTDNSTKTMHHILQATAASSSSGVVHRNPVSAMLIAGDLSYADGDPHRWERWLELMEPLLRTTSLQAAAGNHEIECDNDTSAIFVPYENYFRNPNRLGPADMEPVSEDYRQTLRNGQCTTPSQFLGHYNYGNSFYSFQHGLAHVIVLNSYTSTLPGSPQYHWLDEELKLYDRDVTPWLLVMFHCPLHTTFSGHVDEMNPKLMMLAMEPLFVEYGVNIILSGHDHAYLRTKPMVGSSSDPTRKGPIYLTLGAGGNRELHSSYINDIPEEWVATRDDDEYGYGHLFLANATHAHLTWVRDGTTDKGIHDTVWLQNQHMELL